MIKETKYEFEKIINSYPYPISILFSKYIKIKSDDYVERHSQLCDILESTIKFLSIILVKESTENETLKKIYPEGLEFLKHPSLGHWLSIIRKMSTGELDEEGFWKKKISSWYNEFKPDNELLDNYQSLPEINFPKGNSLISGVLSSLVTYRNKVWKGHGAAIVDKSTIVDRVTSLETLLLSILTCDSLFMDMNLYYVNEVKKVGDKKFEASCSSLIGINQNFEKFVYNDFEPNEIYLSHEKNLELTIKPISLSPFAIIQNSNNNPQFYFFNDAKRSKIEYLSYFDSSFYYYKEVKDELKSIIKLDFKECITDYEYKLYNFTEQERDDQGEKEFRKGIELALQGKFEGAILAFEEAIEWSRKPKYIIEMCKSMISAGDDPNYILENLEYVFEIDSTNDEAIQLKKRIENMINDEEGDFVKGDNEVDFRKLDITYFHYLTPSRLRNASTLFWILALFTFYTGASLLLYFLDSNHYLEPIIITGIFLVLSIILVLGVFNAKNKLTESYFALWGQIENMKLSRFNGWFKRVSKNIFGYFSIKAKSNVSDKFDKDDLTQYTIEIDYKNEKSALLFILIFILVWSINIITIQKLYNLSFSIAIIRFITTMVYWILIAILIRYLFGFVKFVKEYSQLELSPIITKLGNNGFQSISKLFLQSLLLLDIFWVLNWSWNVLACKDEMYFDFFGLIFAVIVVIYYIVFTPVFIGKALRTSKSMAVMDYKNHTKQAFRTFIKEPTQDKVEKLDWLLKNQKRVDDVSSRMFNIFQWIFIAFSVLLICLTSIIYIITRLGYLDLVIGFIKNILA